MWSSLETLAPVLLDSQWEVTESAETALSVATPVHRATLVLHAEQTPPSLAPTRVSATTDSTWTSAEFVKPVTLDVSLVTEALTAPA